MVNIDHTHDSNLLRGHILPFRNEEIKTHENAATVNSNFKNVSEENVLDIENLEIAFGNAQILKGINLYLKKGENLVVLGKSGCGKSVLIKCLVGLLEIDKGKLTVLSKNITTLNDKELNSIRKKMGFLFQNAALYDSMTVRENLEFPLRDLKGIDKKVIDSRVEEVLENVGLLGAIDKMPSQLSGGMRKRIGLARTLILKPEIMFYDEPTTGLDPVTSKEISNLILDVQKKYNTSSIIITHDKECAKIVSNRIVMIKDGICAATGTYEELEASENEWVRSFFE